MLRIGFCMIVVLMQPPRSGRFSILDSGQKSSSQRVLSNTNSLLNNGQQETTPSKMCHAYTIKHTLMRAYMVATGHYKATAVWNNVNELESTNSILSM